MTSNGLKSLWMMRVPAVAIGIVALVACEETGSSRIPAGWTAESMTPIGYSDLDGRGGAFKLTIKEVNDRWYLYMGHLWHRGWSIVDVTDPADPRVVKFVPGPDNTWTINQDLHGDIWVTALQGFSEQWGADPDKPFEEGVLVWDISDPVNPQQLSHWKTGGRGTHRNSYPGGSYAHLAANMPGFQGQIYVILDISDPASPKEAGRWWLPGQKEGETATGPVGGLHGPPVIDGTTAYLGYGPAVVILDISDVSQPKLIGRLDMSPPLKGNHGVLPIPGKSLLFANSEAISETCEEPLNHATMIDIQDPAKPRLISVFPVPAPLGEAYADFCAKGGRFGPHNTNHQWHSPDVQAQGDLVYLTYFNAGLRIFDIKNPRVPKEVAWFIPPQPPTRIGPVPSTTLVTQTEDVLVDRRGNIYITDKQWGLFVLRHTGSTGPVPTD